MPWSQTRNLSLTFQKIPDFHMDHFLAELNERREELEGEVFEMLYTLSGNWHYLGYTGIVPISGVVLSPKSVVPSDWIQTGMQGHLLMQGTCWPWNRFRSTLVEHWGSLCCLQRQIDTFIFRFPGVQRSVCGLLLDEEISSPGPLGSSLRERPAAGLIR